VTIGVIGSEEIHFLPNFSISVEAMALASIVVELQIRNTFHEQFVPVIPSVWPPRRYEVSSSRW